MNWKNYFFLIIFFTIFPGVSYGYISEKSSNLFIYVNLNELEKRPSFIKIIEAGKENLKYSKIIDKYTASKEQLNTSVLGKNSIKYFFTNINFPNNNEVNYDFFLFPDNAISFNRLYEICSKVFNNKNISNRVFNNTGQGSLTINNEKNKINLILQQNGKIIIGTNNQDIKSLIRQERKLPAVQNIKEEVYLKLFMPKWLKKEILNSSKEILNNKKSLPTNFDFLNGLETITVRVDFDQGINLDLEFSFLDSTSISLFKLFIDQYLPLIKFELMTIFKGKIPRFINNIKVSLSEKRKVDIKACLCQEELNEVIISKTN